MFSLKRSATIALASTLALALALTGVITVSANTTSSHDQTTLRQQDDVAAWLGVSVTDTDNGVTIAQVVPDSPADEAGLRHGDIVTAVGDTEIDSAELLVNTIQAHAPGDEIELTYTRGDTEDTITVTLAERPAEVGGEQPFRPGPAGEPMVRIMSMFGLNLEVTDDGMIIQAITPNSPFADSGLQEGDLITAIDGDSVVGESMPTAVLGHLRFNEPVVFSIVRDGEEMDVEVELDESALNITPPDSDLQIQPVPAAAPTQLGVQFQTVDAAVAEEQGLDVDHGALIVKVYDDTPAAKAGLLVDDVILAVDGDVVDEEHTLPDRLYAYEEGDVVTLSVLRDGEEIEVEVELGPSNHGVLRFGGPVQGMPLPPNALSGRPGRGRGRGFFGFGPGMRGNPPCMDHFFGGQPDNFFDMHPWGQNGNGNNDDSTITPDTNNGTSM